MSRRIQARRASGRFTRNTLENSFGLSVVICDECRRINPYAVGEPRPKQCHNCGHDFLTQQPERAGSK